MAAAANLTPPSCLVLFHYDVANNETMCDQCKIRSYRQVEAEDLGEGGYQKNTLKQVVKLQASKIMRKLRVRVAFEATLTNPLHTMR
jgi:hypothetical protein